MKYVIEVTEPGVTEEYVRAKVREMAAQELAPYLCGSGTALDVRFVGAINPALDGDVNPYAPVPVIVPLEA